MIGKTLAHYEIRQLLGKGGMGEVYRARDTKLDRDVALKVLPAEMARDAQRLERFEREAKTVAGLNHPHIVTLFSVEEADGVRFLTMELIEGEGLDHLLRSRTLAWEDVRAIGGAVAGALAAAHAKGIVHRDLKPANVMVTADGWAKVLDFGLAKSSLLKDATGSVTASLALTTGGAVVGTVPYMSPEQVRGLPVGPASDLFSFGVLLYEMATGRNPFLAGSAAETMSAILRDEPSWSDPAAVSLPGELAGVVRDCLRKEPADRPDAASAAARLAGRAPGGTAGSRDTVTVTLPAPIGSGAIPRPKGVVTFLFTEVDGIERLWEEHPDSTKDALARYETIAREAIEQARGWLFSSTGSAAAAVFSSTKAAVDAALAAQRAVAAASWEVPGFRVRMGIHTGTAEERDSGYFGATPNRAARIMAAGNGGQVLASRTTLDLLDGAYEFRDRGTHGLEGVPEPEQIFELAHADLPWVDAPLRVVDARRSNLPQYLTTFVGREPIRAELASLVRKQALVVLTGVGGTGKTRLAVETAASLRSEFRDGVWMVELAPVTDPDLVVQTLADVWGLRPGEGAKIDEVLTRYLWPKSVLLIVDNCEHLLDSAASTVRLLLDRCPKLRILATSRESLGIPGEAVVRVPSLGLPTSGTDVAATESGQLFLDRARAVDGSYDPGPKELEAIARIVRRIDGIPLGLELAAARLRSLRAPELAERLEDSFRILSGSAKAALPRQRTLQATIDWSYGLLDEPGRILFRRLSVFSGGFHLDAAEAICAGGALEEWEIVDQLDALVDQSLVTIVPGEREKTRYRLLEPIRQYAQETLGPSGEAEAVRSAHAGWYAEFVAQAAPGTRGPEQMAWERRIEVDHDNVRSAFHTLLSQGDLSTFLRLSFDLFGFWAHAGLQVEAIETSLQGLEAAGAAVKDARPADEDGSAADAATDGAGVAVDAATQVRAWFVVALMGAEITSPQAIGHARSGLAIAEASGDLSLVGMMELGLGAAIRHSTTDPEYLEHLHRARDLLEAQPPGWWEPEWERGFLHLVIGAYLPAEDERVVEHFETALRIFEELGDDVLLAATLGDSVGLHEHKGIDWALRNVRKAVEILDQIHVPYWRAHAHQTLGIMLKLQDEQALAADSFRTAKGLLADCGDLSCWATSSRGLAECEVALGRPQDAARLLADVIDSFSLLPMPEIAMPRTLDSAAETLAALGKPREAAVVLGRSAELPLPPSKIRPRGPVHEALRARLAEALGSAGADAGFAEGREASSEEILEHARAWLMS